MVERDGPLLSFALKPSEEGWTWWVIDEAGGTVANGSAGDRELAQWELKAAYSLAVSRRGGSLGVAA